MRYARNVDTAIIVTGQRNVKRNAVPTLQTTKRRNCRQSAGCAWIRVSANSASIGKYSLKTVRKINTYGPGMRQFPHGYDDRNEKNRMRSLTDHGLLLLPFGRSFCLPLGVPGRAFLLGCSRLCVCYLCCFCALLLLVHDIHIQVLQGGSGRRILRQRTLKPRA